MKTPEDHLWEEAEEKYGKGIAIELYRGFGRVWSKDGRVVLHEANEATTADTVQVLRKALKDT